MIKLNPVEIILASMVIIVDAMGGDFAPSVTIEGSLLALTKLPSNTEINLIGQEEAIRNALKGRESSRLSITNAPEIIKPDDYPAEAVKTKQNSSIVKGLMMCKEKKGQGFVSAGNTGAQVAASIMILGRISGVLRPALCTIFPNINQSKMLLVDIGATIDSKPKQLVQIAQMATAYLETIHNIKSPNIGLVNIGEESTKGTELVKLCYEALKNAHDEKKINFVGNIEGSDVLLSQTNIVLCDGFVGNIILKFAESFPIFLSKALKRTFEEEGKNSDEVTREMKKISDILKKALKPFNDEQFGGVPLLGIDGISIVCHGRSSAHAICNAILLASDMYEKQLNQHIKL